MGRFNSSQSQLVLDVSCMGEIAGLFVMFLRPVKETLEDPELVWRMAEEDVEMRKIVQGNVDRLLERFTNPNGIVPYRSIVRGLEDTSAIMRRWWVEDVTTHKSPEFSANYLEAILGEKLSRGMKREFDDCHLLLEQFIILTRGVAFGEKIDYDQQVPTIMRKLGARLAGFPEAKAKIAFMLCVTIIHRTLAMLQALCERDETRFRRYALEIHPYYKAIDPILE